MAGNLLVQMRNGRELTKRQQIQLICTLSMPAILALTGGAMYVGAPFMMAHLTP
jgi:hypothetical protein